MWQKGIPSGGVRSNDVVVCRPCSEYDKFSELHRCVTCTEWWGRQLEPWKGLNESMLNMVLKSWGLGKKHWRMNGLEWWNTGMEVKQIQTQRHMAISLSLCPPCLYSCLDSRKVAGLLLLGQMCSFWVCVSQTEPCFLFLLSLFVHVTLGEIAFSKALLFVQRLQNTLSVFFPCTLNPSFSFLFPLIFMEFL